MLQSFAVQTLPAGGQTPEFLIVVAEDATQALGAAAQQCLETGKADTQILAVFTRPDLESLVAHLAAAQTQVDLLG